MTVFFSRFNDALTPGAQPLHDQPTELYSFHLTDTKLIMICRWMFKNGEWDQASPIFAESVELARELIPPGCTLVEHPPKFGAVEVWRP